MADGAPPLPFGNTATAPKQIVEASEDDFRALGDRAGIQDVTSLIGETLFERLEVRGEIGTNAGNLVGEALSNDVNRVRQPWVLTCQKWIQEQTYLVCRVNPKDVSWKMPQRSAVQKTRVGEIVHVWKDRFRGTFYDEPSITINFQSGNIMPIREKPLKKAQSQQVGTNIDQFGNEIAIFEERKSIDTSETQPRVPPGLSNFYQFLSLVDEQKILDDGTINFVYIMYNSRIFPNLTLAGLFTPEGVSWTDTSQDPNQVDSWSANFTIYDSYPRLHDLETLMSFFQNAGFGRV